MTKLPIQSWMSWIAVPVVILIVAVLLAGIWNAWHESNRIATDGKSSKSAADQEDALDAERKEFLEKNRLPTETKRILEQADDFVLYSLYPARIKEIEEQKKQVGKEFFHDFMVLGKTEVGAREVRERLLNALFKGISESDGSIAMCFSPRHGIRAVLNGETVDLIICFECLQIETHAAAGKSVLTSASPEPVLDHVLKEAGVELAPK